LRAALCDHEFFFENKDGRLVLIFPLFDKVMIGTSDLAIEDPDSARCTEAEVDYFLQMVGHVFPGIQVSREQIIFRFSGVRPLAYASARTTGQITRNHHIREDYLGGIPVYSLVGGKWTSFRAFSEQVTDRVLAFLHQDRRLDTRSLPIGANHDPRLKTDPHYSPSEIAGMVKQEKIVHLDDLLLRRTLLAYLGLLTRPLVEELAGVIGNTLEWNPAQRTKEVERAIQILAEHHGVQL
jgi:glycerol-3-phosphate dehydrogenase